MNIRIVLTIVAALLLLSFAAVAADPPAGITGSGF
jgi:hypothetical protein